MIQSGQKSLVFFSNQWWPHVDASHQVALRRLQEGRLVAFADLTEVWDVGFGQMWPSWASRLGMAPNRRKVSQQLADEFPGQIEILVPELRAEGGVSDALVRDLHSLVKIQEIQEISLKGRNLGYSLLSTSYSDAARTDLSTLRIRRMIGRLLPQCLAVNRWVSDLFESGDYSEVVVFNGRFAYERSVILAALQNGVDVTYHEALADGRYTTLSGSIHGQEIFQAEVERTWTVADPLSRVGMAEEWFRNRISLRSPDVSRWTGTWDVGNSAPPEREPALDRPLVAIFSSSDDEFASISEEYDLPDGITQFERIRNASKVALGLGMDVVVRLHPNYSNKSRAMTKEWMSLCGEGIEVVPPSAPMNSYSLIQRADVVATCGSTVGIEAAYLERPTVLLAPSLYGRLGVAVCAYDDFELERILRRSDFMPIQKAKESALKVAYFDLVRWVSPDPSLPSMRTSGRRWQVKFAGAIWGLWRRWRRFKRLYL